ncbi:MAG: methyltransferase domain-containing protein [Mucilaginibacter sp.]
MNDVLGRAIFDYHHQNKPGQLWIHNQYGPKEEMPLDIFFRPKDDMSDIELLALDHCRGKVLDIGAGAGSHSLLLQQGGTDVTAIDISPLAVQVMQARGVKKVYEANIFTYHPRKFDTLLLLMNGIGLAGTLHGLKQLLMHLRLLLNDGGQVLFDSSDVAYVYEEIGLPANNYYGEIPYQYQYKTLTTDWFSWLYIDKNTLHDIAVQVGFKLQILAEDEYGQYLARLIV